MTTAVTLTRREAAPPPEEDNAVTVLRLAYRQAQSYAVRAYHPRYSEGSRFAARLSLLYALGELEGLTSGKVLSGASTGSEMLNLMRLGALFRTYADRLKFELADDRFGWKG